MYGLISFLMNNFLYLFLKVSYTQSFPPPLSQREEEEYFRRMREGDKKAREKLIEHNLRLVAHIVKKYYTASESQEDLISIGTIGLIKAIDSLTPKTVRVLPRTQANACKTKFLCTSARRKNAPARFR